MLKFIMFMKIEVENETYLFIVSYPTFFRVYECVLVSAPPVCMPNIAARRSLCCKVSYKFVILRKKLTNIHRWIHTHKLS